MIRIKIIAAVTPGLAEKTAVFNSDMAEEFHINQIEQNDEWIKQSSKKFINEIMMEPAIILWQAQVLLASSSEILVKGSVIFDRTHRNLLYNTQRRKQARLARTIVAPVGRL